MLTRFLSPLLAALLAAPSPTARADELPDAEALLARMEAHTGSPEQRARVVSVVYRGEVQAEGMPGKASVEELLLGPGRCRTNVTYAPGMKMTMGCTDAFSWGTDPSVGIMVSHQRGGPVQRFYGVQRRVHWKSLYQRAETVGTEEVGGRRCVKLRMIPLEGEPDHWLVDPAENTLARVDTVFPGPMGEKLAMQFHLNKWQRVGDVLFAAEKIQQTGDFSVTYAYSQIEVNPELEMQLAEPPDDVKAKAAENKAESKPVAGEFLVETLAARPVCSVRIQVKSDEISQQLAVILPEVVTHVTQNGGAIAGPPFSRYHNMGEDSEMMDLEAGIPVAMPVPAGGRVMASELPAGRCAVTWHIGPYDQMDRSYQALQDWMQGEGLTPVGGPWEVYWTDPGIQTDPSQWKTQLLWPVEG